MIALGTNSAELAIALGYLSALGGTDPDAVADLVASDFRNEHQAEFGTGCVGRDEYRSRLPNFFAQFPNRTYDVVEIAVGDLITPSDTENDGSVEVVVRYRFHADAGDHRIDIPGVMWISVRDSRVTRRIDTWDSLTYLRQTDQSPG
jgi:hypothetical protein